MTSPSSPRRRSLVLEQLEEESPLPGGEWGSPGPREHLVLIYETERALARSVVTFLTPALLRDEAILVVATPGRRALFASALTAAGEDVPRLRQLGRYTELDAETTLEAFLRGGRLSRMAFNTAVGHPIRSLAAAHGLVHIYGEMVACLWGRGDAAAAIELEQYWNDLALTQEFRLCCAYHADSVSSPAEAAHDMLSAHSVVRWPDGARLARPRRATP